MSTALPTPTDLAVAKHVQATDLSNCELYGEDGFWVADLAVVRNQLDRWKKSLPFVRPFYAVKCNPTPRLLSLLAAPCYGLGFDCATHAEIAQTLSLGVSPSDIIYANPCKAPSHLRYAASASVTTMTFDNAAELHKIKKCCPAARCVLRIKLTPGAYTDSAAEDPRYDLSLKYGVALAGAQELLLLAKSLGLMVVGVAFHVGSGQSDCRAYLNHIVEARKVWDMAAEVGYRFTLLDIGGGFMDESFEDVAGSLREAIETEFGDVMKNTEGMEVIAEPGRFFCATAFTLVTSVIAVRGEEEGTDEAGKRMLYLADGIYSNINAAMWPGELTFPTVVKGRKMGTMKTRDSQLVPTPSSTSSASSDSGIDMEEGSSGEDGGAGAQLKGAMQECSVWGPTCDCGDVILKSAWLPRDIEVGDWFVFKGLGAYSVCMRNPFNGFSTDHKFYYLNE
ncbi:hypothetical protein DRE_06791 [Drechslerella stenobrocha 248]|uniref:Orn/DAP/Arg decarboxylase 2 N-terminal domain-containing protein n=1 Tax=Drechslerella stenobrocha 248 TaxID=1043628 RepID=W7HWU3_9PEZI|nr:hypothetical protein DRE_06791 [Drechslerella stenobrocha 248]